MESMRRVLGASDMMAYLVMMGPRLVELRRVLKSSGSIYLHCDPTASHYLKLLMDAVFGARQYQNEIVWQRTNAHNMRTRTWVRTNDTILFYSKTGAFGFNTQFTDYGPEQLKRFHADEDGRLYKAENLTFSTANPSRQFEWRGTKPPPNRSWGFSIEELEEMYSQGRILLKRDGTPRMDGWKIYLDETTGKPITTNWTDIERISNTAAERLGYPTQKPLKLLERIISASSTEGQVVLDPFCGCGTAVDAAQELNRHWIGIDITYIAVDLIIKRLKHRYGDSVTQAFRTNGIPTDIEGAEAFFNRNPFDFERWAVSFVHGQPNEHQIGDKGVDGRIRFHRGGDLAGVADVSVKGGKQLNPMMVQALVGAMEEDRAEMGVLVTLHPPTSGMRDTAAKAGIYEHPPTGNRYPRVQLITIPELFDGKRPNMPTVILPYIKAKARPQSEAVSLFDSIDPDEIDE